MPLVMRRSPESEKAAIYGYGDLLRDIIGKISTGATREVARMTSGEMSNEELMEMALAGVGAGTKIARGLGKGKFPFSLKTTDVPLWDAVLRRPGYHKKEKGVRKSIEFMSPKEYFDKLYEGRGLGYSKEMEMQVIDEGLVRKYTQQMREGTKFPMPGLEYRGRKFGQEGRHRMLAAEALGIDRVPVLTMRSKPQFGMPILKTTEEALAFGRSAPREAEGMLRRAMRAQERVVQEAKDIFHRTKATKDADEWMKQATKRQFYREALEVMTGEMP